MPTINIPMRGVCLRALAANERRRRGKRSVKLTIVEPGRGDIGLRVDGGAAAHDVTAACRLSRTFRKCAVRGGHAVAEAPRAPFRRGVIRRTATPAMLAAGRTASCSRERDSAGSPPVPKPLSAEAVVAVVEIILAIMNLRTRNANIQCQQSCRDHCQADDMSECHVSPPRSRKHRPETSPQTS
jgi:hypothetical protein